MTAARIRRALTALFLVAVALAGAQAQDLLPVPALSARVIDQRNSSLVNPAKNALSAGEMKPLGTYGGVLPPLGHPAIRWQLMQVLCTPVHWIAVPFTVTVIAAMRRPPRVEECGGAADFNCEEAILSQR